MFSGFTPAGGSIVERQTIFVVLRRRLHRARSNAAPNELVDRRQQQLRIRREILRRVDAAAGVRDGRDVARAEVRLDELARMLAHDGRANRSRCSCRRARSRTSAADRLAIRADILTGTGLSTPGNSGGISSGISTNESAAIFCGCPSSNSSKSSIVRPTTESARSSVTMASTSMRLTSAWKVDCGLCA